MGVPPKIQGHVLTKHKAPFVARGFTQVSGMDYHDAHQWLLLSAELTIHLSSGAIYLETSHRPERNLGNDAALVDRPIWLPFQFEDPARPIVLLPGC